MLSEMDSKIDAFGMSSNPGNARNRMNGKVRGDDARHVQPEVQLVVEDRFEASQVRGSCDAAMSR